MARHDFALVCLGAWALGALAWLLSATRDGSGSPLMQQPETRRELVRAGGGR